MGTHNIMTDKSPSNCSDNEDGANESTKHLKGEELETGEEQDEKYPTVYRRNKIDMSSGFTDLKAGRSDSYVREFIEKLKEKRESSKMDKKTIVMIPMTMKNNIV